MKRKGGKGPGENETGRSTCTGGKREREILKDSMSDVPENEKKGRRQWAIEYVATILEC